MENSIQPNLKPQRELKISGTAIILVNSRLTIQKKFNLLSRYPFLFVHLQFKKKDQLLNLYSILDSPTN